MGADGAAYPAFQARRQQADERARSRQRPDVCLKHRLPVADDPQGLAPRSTVYDYFDLSSWDGTLDCIHEALYARCREAASREASPTAAIIDSQSVKSAEKILCGWTAAGLGRLSFHTSMEATDAVRHLRGRCRDHRPGE